MPDREAVDAPDHARRRRCRPHPGANRQEPDVADGDEEMRMMALDRSGANERVLVEQTIVVR